jgi:rubrerythrin
MTGRELIFELLNNPDINLDQEVALATKDGAFKNMEQAMFHIQKIIPMNECVTVLWFDDIRHQKGPMEERSHGEWRKGMHNDMDNIYCRCSVCNFIDYQHKFSKFCPNCGADMRGGRE